MTPYQSEMWDIAHTTAKYSKDPSTKVGAVAAKNKRVIGTGRNGFPPRVFDHPDIYKRRNLKLLMVNHAEANLTAVCGRDLEGSDVFVTLPPCSQCSGLLIAAGIKAVYTKPITDLNSQWYWSWKLSKAMFQEAGVDVFELDSIWVFNKVESDESCFDAAWNYNQFLEDLM